MFDIETRTRELVLEITEPLIKSFLEDHQTSLKMNSNLEDLKK